MLFGLKEVFQDWEYILLAFIVAFVVFVFAVLLPNIPLLVQVLPMLGVSVWVKIKIIFGLLGAIKTNFSIFSAIYTIIIAILFGINVSLFTYFIRKQKQTFKNINSGAGIGGLISGILGIGCAACGTFILTWVLGLVGVAGIISYLPLGGEEFGILGIGLLLYALISTSRKIIYPQVC